MWALPVVGSVIFKEFHRFRGAGSRGTNLGNATAGRDEVEDLTAELRRVSPGHTGRSSELLG
jgi:hypothetical protein